MALPSQSARTASAGRSYMTRKGRSNLKPIIGGGVVVFVVALAGWALMRTGEGHADVTPPQVAVPEAAAAKPVEPSARAAVPEVKPEPPPPPVFELRQGRGQAGITGEPTTAQQQPVQQLQAEPPARPLVQQTPVVPAPVPAAQLAVNSGLPTDLQAKVSAARAKDMERDWVAARFLYSQALADARLSEMEKNQIRDRLGIINDELIFSPKVARDDPFADFYVVQGGDNLIRIAQKLKTSADWRLLQRINRLSNPGALTVGQRLKVIQHPFHAVVHKYAYRIDVYLGPAERPEQWVFVKSLRVGLGESDSTPLGSFVVRKGSKMVNPPWTNPRTGERFAGNDPKNPIGKHWIGLEGQGEAAAYTGYGIHGTIEPDSIGQQRSMGCIRMQAEDVALMYELLTEQGSQIQIRP